jgi:hypothetical protein
MSICKAFLLRKEHMISASWLHWYTEGRGRFNNIHSGRVQVQGVIGLKNAVGFNDYITWQSTSMSSSLTWPQTSNCGPRDPGLQRPCYQKPSFTSNNDNYSDWSNTCEVRYQLLDPQALSRAKFHCFLHGNCSLKHYFVPYSLSFGMSLCSFLWVLRFYKTEVMSFWETSFQDFCILSKCQSNDQGDFTPWWNYKYEFNKNATWELKKNVNGADTAWFSGHSPLSCHWILTGP